MATVRTMKKILLGREIAYMMKTAGKAPADLASILATSRSRVGDILSGQGTISVGDVERLANQLGFTDAGHHEFLFDLARNAHKRGYWTTGHRRAYSEDVRQRVDAEGLVNRIREFEVEVIPGLLQEERYVRALYAGIPAAGTSGITIDDHVKARTSRQEILFKDDAPQVHFVMSESCLARVRCERPDMIDQLEHIIRLSQRENVMIQILPFEQPVGRRTKVSNRFTLMRIPNAGVAGPLEFVFTEDEGGMRYGDERRELDAYDRTWTQLSANALAFDETRDFIRQWIDQLKKKTI